MSQVSFTTELPVSPDEAFTFVSDPHRWALFRPGVAAVEYGDDWGTVGGHAQVTSRSLLRTRTSLVEITEWDEPLGFGCSWGETGAAERTERWTFDGLEGSTRVTATVTLPDGPGGLMDRFQALLARRTLRRTMMRLGEAVPTRHVGPAARI